jgi:hypothetical protein
MIAGDGLADAAIYMKLSCGLCGIPSGRIRSTEAHSLMFAGLDCRRRVTRDASKPARQSWMTRFDPLCYIDGKVCLGSGLYGSGAEVGFATSLASSQRAVRERRSH